MDIYEANLACLREFDLGTIRAAIFAANAIANTAESLDVALCRAEEKRVPKGELYDRRGERIETSIIKEISRGCAKARESAERMSIGELIGHLVYCAKWLAVYAEPIERERDPEMEKSPTISQQVYIKAAFEHLWDRPEDIADLSS